MKTYSPFDLGFHRGLTTGRHEPTDADLEWMGEQLGNGSTDPQDAVDFAAGMRGKSDPSPRVTRCFLLIDHVRSKHGRYKARLVSRRMSTDLYVSKPCDTEQEARDLATKYLARHPEFVVWPSNAKEWPK